MHQALRFFPDESAGYEYPEIYRTMFGEDYRPEPYIVADYERARKHRWYMSARMICVNDLYSFDPDVEVELEQFEDVVGRHFRQPPEGLGNDDTPASHMWRTLRRPLQRAVAGGAAPIRCSNACSCTTPRSRNRAGACRFP